MKFGKLVSLYRNMSALRNEQTIPLLDFLQSDTSEIPNEVNESLYSFSLGNTIGLAILKSIIEIAASNIYINVPNILVSDKKEGYIKLPLVFVEGILISLENSLQICAVIPTLNIPEQYTDKRHLLDHFVMVSNYTATVIGFAEELQKTIAEMEVYPLLSKQVLENSLIMDVYHSLDSSIEEKTTNVVPITSANRSKLH